MAETVKYLAVIHKDDGSDYGVSFPDVPGVVTAGKTADEAYALAEEALQLHVNGMVEDEEALPEVSSLEDYLATGDDAINTFWVTVTVPRASVAKSYTATMDADLLKQMDDVAKEKGKTRSGFIAEAVREKLNIYDGGGVERSPLYRAILKIAKDQQKKAEFEAVTVPEHAVKRKKKFSEDREGV